MDSEGTYRDMQTKFVSHLSGSSLWEVVWLTAIIPSLSVLLRNLLLLLIRTERNLLIFTVDFLFCYMPSLLAVTILSRYLIEMSIIMVIVAGLFMIGLLMRISNQMKRRKIIINRIAMDYVYGSYEGNHMHITAIRAYTLMCTCMCILAVDFVIFPRRFAKTESFGVSFMDVGVGAFIVSNAVVSPESRRLTDNRTIKEKIQNFLKVVKGSVALFILGVMRLISVKGTNYQEHITEYGVHWNFFFTLFFVKLIVSAFLSLLPSEIGIFPSQIFSFGYEYSLSNLGLMAYILSDQPRDDFIDGNREGIFSLAGYVSLYLFGVEIGRKLFSRGNRGFVFIMVSSVLGISILIGTCLYYNGFQVSRRLANLGYVMICVFIFCLSLLAFMAADFVRFMFASFVDTLSRPLGKPVSRRSKKKRTPEESHDIDEKTKIPSEPPAFNLLKAVNDNGLAYFLVANLLTGLVNFSMETIRASRTTGFLVILGYSITLTLLFSVLSMLKIRLKCW